MRCHRRPAPPCGTGAFQGPVGTDAEESGGNFAFARRGRKPLCESAGSGERGDGYQPAGTATGTSAVDKVTAKR